MSAQLIAFYVLLLLSHAVCNEITTTVQGHPASSQINTSHVINRIDQISYAYTMAQAVAWLNSTYFVVGAWSGILSLYHHQNGIQQLQLKHIVKSDQGDGIQMVSNLLPGNRFVTSNTKDSLFLHIYDPVTNILSSKLFSYSPSAGFANSVAYSEPFLVTGHENGCIIIWYDSGSIFYQVRLVNISSPNPIPSPFPLKNIRGLSVWTKNLFVSGSEDGDICIIEVPSGNIIARKRYNPTAQRGINDLQVYQNYLLVANCAVGQIDKNTWFYKLEGDSRLVSIQLLDAVNLQKDISLTQVFNFNVAMGFSDGYLAWFASTLEGLLWFGIVSNGKLVVQGNNYLGVQQGSALDYVANKLVAVSNNAFVYQVSNQLISRD